jgi:hypothetical protein
MGLDMYLSSVPKVKSLDELKDLKKALTISYFNGTFEETMKKLKKDKDFIYDIPIEISYYINKDNFNQAMNEGSYKIELEMRLGYWRKFNALHSWFVKNVQKEVDDCGSYIVTKKQLESLHEELKLINEHNVDEILPTQEGFFFGGTEYDEYYWEEIEYLKGFLIYILTQVDDRERTLIYQSSW